MLTYLLAVLAACANATSSVLQRKANRRAPQQDNLSLRLLWSLAHEPVWFGGALCPRGLRRSAPGRPGLNCGHQAAPGRLATV